MFLKSKDGVNATSSMRNKSSVSAEPAMKDAFLE